MADPTAIELDHLRIFTLDAESIGRFRYARLAERALVYQLPERVLVADLADVIASKAAAGREKDLTRLPELRRLQQLRAAQHEGAGGEAPG